MTTMVGVLRNASILALTLVAMVTILVARDPAFSAADEDWIRLDVIRKFCAKHHPRDAKKQRQCFEEQHSAAVAVINLVHENFRDKDWLEGLHTCTAHDAPKQVRDMVVVHRCLEAIPRKPQVDPNLCMLEAGALLASHAAMRRYWEIAKTDDRAAMERYVTQLLDQQQAFKMPQSVPAYVEERDGVLMRIRPKGMTESLWTFNIWVNCP